MKATASRTKPQALKRSRKPRRKAYHVATCGRERVPVYKRTAPNGSPCFMVANYSGGKRRFDSYADEALALEAAGKLARQLSEREVLAAAMTNEQASEYAAALQKLAPFNVGLLSAADAVAGSLKLVGDLPNLHAAVKFYCARRKQTTAKRVADVVAELLAVKAARGASVRYLQDLRSRLGRFAEAFRKNAGDVTTAAVQEWLDGLKLSPQSYKNFQTVLHLLFGFCVARGYAADNPVATVESVKVSGRDVEIYTPGELAKLLTCVAAGALPAMAIGAFAGLRTAEIQRLDWRDVDLSGGFVTVSADKAKTGARRIVPILPALGAWLAPYACKTGCVWGQSDFPLHAAWRAAATAAGVAWKSNALRHSFASYRLAATQNAAQVSLEMGNSPQVVFRHYRELVKPAEAERWFDVKPEAPANVLPLTTVANV
jgi:integrase